jgi:hypothetical protein
LGRIYDSTIISSASKGDIPLGTRLVGPHSGDQVGRGSASLPLGSLLSLFVPLLPSVSFNRQEDRELTSVVD